MIEEENVIFSSCKSDQSQIALAEEDVSIGVNLIHMLNNETQNSNMGERKDNPSPSKFSLQDQDIYGVSSYRNEIKVRDTSALFKMTNLKKQFGGEVN